MSIKYFQGVIIFPKYSFLNIGMLWKLDINCSPYSMHMLIVFVYNIYATFQLFLSYVTFLKKYKDHTVILFDFLIISWGANWIRVEQLLVIWDGISAQQLIWGLLAKQYIWIQLGSADNLGKASWKWKLWSSSCRTQSSELLNVSSAVVRWTSAQSFLDWYLLSVKKCIAIQQNSSEIGSTCF